MNELIAQAGGGGGSPQFTIVPPTVDWATLIPQLVGYFFDGIGQFLNTTLHSAFDGLWHSGTNVVGQTDLAMTWGFGPVQDQVMAVQAGARAVLLFALILLGLRGMLSSIIPRQQDMIAEFINGILGAVILVAAFPLVVPMIIDLTNQAASAVGEADLSRFVTTGGSNDALVEGVLFIILLFFALRLLMKAIWRIGFLAIMLPVGMIACALYAVPQTRWILGWWAKLWGGMLLAQIPSVMALTIGAQLFAHGSGMGAFVYSIAFLQLATDIYSVIPFGQAGVHTIPPWGAIGWPGPAVLGSVFRGTGAIGAAAGVASAAVGAGALASQAGGSAAPTYGYQ